MYLLSCSRVHHDISKDENTILMDTLIIHELFHGVQSQLNTTGLNELFLQGLCKDKENRRVAH